MQDEPRGSAPQEGDDNDAGGPSWSPKAPPDLNIILRGGDLAPEQEPDGWNAEEGSAPRPPARPSVRYTDEEPLRRPDPAAAASAPEFEASSGVNAMPIIVGLAVVLLIVVGFFTLPTLLGKKDGAATPDKPAAGNSASGGAEGTELVGLEPYTIDEPFWEDLKEGLELGNARSLPAGYYAYRYSMLEKTERGLSQTITITAFLGGKGADAAAKEGGGKEFREGIQPYLDNLNARQGVQATLMLRSTGGNEAPAAGDRWLSYGLDYYKENKAQIGEIVSMIDAYKHSEGQYPTSLLTAAPGTKTKGNPSYEAGGYGYLPVFKTDGSGNILMGSGTGVASYNPQEVTGYYLFVFLRDPALGQDVLSPENVQYYIDKISPFPYKPDGPIRNMPMTPDGKPDGIAVVLKDGVPVE